MTSLANELPNIQKKEMKNFMKIHDSNLLHALAIQKATNRIEINYLYKPNLIIVIQTVCLPSNSIYSSLTYLYVHSPILTLPKANTKLNI